MVWPILARGAQVAQAAWRVARPASETTKGVVYGTALGTAAGELLRKEEECEEEELEEEEIESAKDESLSCPANSEVVPFSDYGSDVDEEAMNNAVLPSELEDEGDTENTVVLENDEPDEEDDSDEPSYLGVEATYEPSSLVDDDADD